MKIEVKTGTHKVRHVDRYGVPADRIQPVVIVSVDGVPFYHDCDTPESARALVVRMSYALGLDK